MTHEDLNNSGFADPNFFVHPSSFRSWAVDRSDGERRAPVQNEDSRNTLIQTGLRLELKILEKLRIGRGVSEEIRDRLQRTFAEDELDAVTRELRDGIVNIAKLLRRDFGTEWHASPAAHEAFAAALAQRIAAYAPAPEAAPIVPESEIPGPPDIIGRLRERDDRGAHTYKYRYLTAALKAKSGATD